MNQKSFILAVILAAAALSVIATPLAFAQGMDDEREGDEREGDEREGDEREGDETDPATGDTSRTHTDQKLKQKNVGSGDAEQNNCAEQLIKAGADRNCRFVN